MRPPARRPGVLRIVLVLGLLEAFGPFSMDLYLPQLPQLAADLDVPAALAQATMSACMIGLGVGQLIAGPLSDRFGRRRPLLIGVTAFALLSVMCAVAPGIEVLLLARFAQGVAGSAGIVISLAVARDLFSGTELSRMLSLLLLVSGSAPVVAPLIGGQLAAVMDWRGVFWVLGGVGAALLALVVLGLPETLATGDRHTGRAALGGHLGSVLRDRLFLAVLAATAAGGVAFFAYLSMSSFVLQDGFGLTAQTFSLVFAANATASIAGGQCSRLLVTRLGPLRMYLLGASAAALACVALLVLVLCGAGLAGVIAALLVFMFVAGTSGPNGSTLALAQHGARAGTASALLGMSTYVFGPAIVPLASLGGVTATTMAVVMAVAALAAAAFAWYGVRPAAAYVPAAEPG
ncbi:MAG: multidrug effflux MFS transporter [Microbacterium sp.]|uniref:multidrug effflux MFS transporter n=1 Tax=Microbacterium sp. TaxID=51671 RepID=UPI0039E48DBA